MPQDDAHNISVLNSDSQITQGSIECSTLDGHNHISGSSKNTDKQTIMRHFFCVNLVVIRQIAPWGDVIVLYKHLGNSNSTSSHN